MNGVVVSSGGVVDFGEIIFMMISLLLQVVVISIIVISGVMILSGGIVVYGGIVIVSGGIVIIMFGLEVVVLIVFLGGVFDGFGVVDGYSFDEGVVSGVVIGGVSGFDFGLMEVKFGGVGFVIVLKVG